MNPEDLLRMIDVIHRDKDIPKEVIFRGLEEALAAGVRKRLGAGEDLVVTHRPQERRDHDRGRRGGVRVRPGRARPHRRPGRASRASCRSVREAERDVLFDEYETRVGQLVNGTVQRFDGDDLVINLGRVEAYLPQARSACAARPSPPATASARSCVEVRKDGPRVRILVSRTHPDLVRRLFELEVPEIADGIIEIKRVVREPGYRTKMAVISQDPKIDCIGACVGVRGSRIKAVIDELRGERIDIIRWSDSLETLIMNGLKPATIHLDNIYPDVDTHSAVVIVDEDQQSLAIGKKGQNVRLASRLCGWDIDIKTRAEFEADSRHGASDGGAAETRSKPPDRRRRAATRPPRAKAATRRPGSAKLHARYAASIRTGSRRRHSQHFGRQEEAHLRPRQGVRHVRPGPGHQAPATSGFTEIKGHMTALDDFEVLRVAGRARGLRHRRRVDAARTTSCAAGGLTVKKRKKKTSARAEARSRGRRGRTAIPSAESTPEPRPRRRGRARGARPQPCPRPPRSQDQPARAAGRPRSPRPAPPRTPRPAASSEDAVEPPAGGRGGRRSSRGARRRAGRSADGGAASTEPDAPRAAGRRRRSSSPRAKRRRGQGRRLHRPLQDPERSRATKPESRRLRSQGRRRARRAADARPRPQARAVRGDHGARGQLTAPQLRESEAGRFLRRRGPQRGRGPARRRVARRGSADDHPARPRAGTEVDDRLADHDQEARRRAVGQGEPGRSASACAPR